MWWGIPADYWTDILTHIIVEVTRWGFGQAVNAWFNGYETG